MFHWNDQLYTRLQLMFVHMSVMTAHIHPWRGWRIYLSHDNFSLEQISDIAFYWSLESIRQIPHVMNQIAAVRKGNAVFFKTLTNAKIILDKVWTEERCG